MDGTWKHGSWRLARNTACLNCEDGEPLNDLTLTVALADGGGFGGFSTFFLGFVAFDGNLQAIRDVNLTIEGDIRMVTQQTNPPTAEYPLPSVSYGTLTGFLLGANLAGGCGFDFVEDCCFGNVGGVSFKSPIGPSLWEIQNTPNGVGFAAEAAWSEAPYTPEVTAVPEPTTLLLLGSGLISAEVKRRRRHLISHSAGCPLQSSRSCHCNRGR